MATRRREVALLVEENGLYRVTRVTVTADSDEEAARILLNPALAAINPSATVLGICKSKTAGTATGSEEILIEKTG